MFYVPQSHSFRHGKRKPKKVGGMFLVTPPRCGRVAIRSFLTKKFNAYAAGDYPHRKSSIDIPKWLWKQDEDFTKALLIRNPFNRLYSLWLMNKAVQEPARKDFKSFSKFVEFLYNIDEYINDYLYWPLWFYASSSEAIKTEHPNIEFKGVKTSGSDAFVPGLGEDYMAIEAENAVEAFNSIGLGELSFDEDEIPYTRPMNENWPCDKWKADFDKNTVQLIRRMYRTDFELFGYSTKIEDA